MPNSVVKGPPVAVPVYWPDNGASRLGHRLLASRMVGRREKKDYHRLAEGLLSTAGLGGAIAGARLRMED